MNSDPALLFVYELFHSGIKIWAQNKNIKIFIPKGVTFTDEQQNFLKINKAKIYCYLEDNQIYSKQHNLVILKSGFNESELSFAQERLWFIEKYEEGTNAYNIPTVCVLSNGIQLDILEKSIKSIVSRHEVLRTVIKEDNEGHSYQVVLDKPLELVKITVQDQEQLDQELYNEINHTYDLSNEYPIRVCLYKLATSISKSDAEYYLSIVIHHIAFDGWSHVIFFRELQTYYDYYLKQSQGLDSILTLPSVGIQYKDFTLWQRSYLTGARLVQQLNYWKTKLSGYEGLNLVTDKPRPNRIDYRGNNIYFQLDEILSTALRTLAKELKISLYSVLLAGYYLMLRSYSNQDDIVIGTPVANRHYSQIEDLVGFFANSLVLRTKIDTKTSIKKFIETIGNEIVEAQLYQDLPFEKLVEELGLAKDTSRHPIFQVMFVVQGFGGSTYKQDNKQVKDDLAYLLQPYEPRNSLYNVARFDITTFIDDSHSTLRGSFNFAVSLYDETTIRSYIETYKEILTQFTSLTKDKLRHVQTKIADLRYLDATRYQQLIYTWNKTDKEYTNNKTLQTLFEEQVTRTPDSIALIYDNNKLTYEELNKRANQLANYLMQNQTVTPDTLITLCLDRSEYILIAILGVLKAGGAYVPINPNYPDERITFILRDTGSRILLTNKSYKQKLEHIVAELKTNIVSPINTHPYSIEILSIDSNQLQQRLSFEQNINPQTITTHNNLAYVIYTSGTTGKPKGVLQLHSNVMRLFTATDDLYHFINNDVWALFHSYVFDFTIWEIWGALIYGGKLIIPTYEQTRELEAFYKLCQTEQVTVLNQTPTAFYRFADIALSNNANRKLTQLRYVIFGGEALNLSQLKLWFKYYGNHPLKLINMYGITETTVHATYKPIEEEDLGESSYIGKLIPDLKAYVLDSNLKPLPIGAVGELYLGGVGLARGYLNRPDLTAERFIANPFQRQEEQAEHKNIRLYKTGDLVRWLPNGNLEYIGRNDFQVKIRGYRIELGEIEATLSKYKGIKQNVVVAKEHRDIDDVRAGNKYLIGYYVSDKDADQEEILNYLSTRLPEYMVPSILVKLERLPLTINGKLDKKALPDPEFTNEEGYIAPRNELERTICYIWAEVLGLPQHKIGITDNFFRLGGNSILAIRLASKINAYYQAHLKVSDIFVYKNVKLLLARILQTKESYQTIVQLNNTYQKPNLFMIHPGIGGCEVYISLADKLVNNFSCYGVDSYNLYQDVKIEDLHELAKYYLSYINQVMTDTSQKVYHLLGWSIGGQIALEIASILEQRGNKEVKVYLLDSVLYDESLFSNLDNDVVDTINAYREDAIAQGYDKLYIEKSILNIEIEKKLVKHKISSILNNTNALLFKALLGDQRYKMGEYHNIDKVFRNKFDIKIIKVNNAHHGNILEQEELLVSEITAFSQL